jgi:hypothetical protein
VACERESLVPVTRTKTVLTVVKLQERLPLPDPVTLPGVIVHAVVLVDRVTTPAKLFCAVTVMEEVPTEPALTVIEVGLTAIKKSWTLKVTVIE